MKSYCNELTLLKFSSHSKLLSKSYGRSKFCPSRKLQFSITFCLKLQISIVITFWRAITVMHTPSKIQIILNHCPKVIGCWNLCPLNGRLRIFTISNLHKFCNTTPNSSCKHNLESSWYKEQYFKVSIQKSLCSMSYIQSNFCFKPTLSHPHTHTKESLSKLFRKYQVEVGHISPYPPT